MRDVSKLITGLPTFLGSFSFFGDELHMIGHGLGHMICNLLDPTIKDKFFSPLLVYYSFDVSPVYNRSQLMNCISRWTFSSRRTNPSVFDYHHGVEGVYSDSNNCEITLRYICFFHMRFQRKIGRNTMRTDAETQELGRG